MFATCSKGQNGYLAGGARPESMFGCAWVLCGCAGVVLAPRVQGALHLYELCKFKDTCPISATLNSMVQWAAAIQCSYKYLLKISPSTIDLSLTEIAVVSAAKISSLPTILHLYAQTEIDLGWKIWSSRFSPPLQKNISFAPVWAYHSRVCLSLLWSVFSGLVGYLWTVSPYLLYSLFE